MRLFNIGNILGGLKNRFGINYGRYFNPTTSYNEVDELHKLTTIFSSPALLKVIMLQCDLFSLGKWQVEENGKVKDKDPVLKLLKNPNYFQSGKQLLWDFCFWNMLGNAVLYMRKNTTDRSNKIYCLHPSKIEFPNNFETDFGDKIVLTDKVYNDIQNTIIQYRYNDGSSFPMKLKELIFISDISNGLGNWYKGNSRIDALYKIISNSEAAIDAKNINARYLAKFIITGKIDETRTDVPMMGQGEKQEIEDRIDSNRKKVHAVKTPVDIKRFIDSSGILKDLTGSYLAEYYIIGKMFGIPKDVLEAHEKGSTYENQEKGRGSHVSYTLEPKGDDLGERVGEKIGFVNKSLSLSWLHLPFMQVFEKERAEVGHKRSKTLNELLKAGATRESAAIEVGFNNIEFVDNEPPEGTTEEE